MFFGVALVFVAYALMSVDDIDGCCIDVGARERKPHARDPFHAIPKRALPSSAFPILS
jgi:hypothetical protein